MSLSPQCQACLDQRWGAALDAAAQPRCFNGPCGCSAGSATVRFKGQLLLTLVIQTPIPTEGRPPVTGGTPVRDPVFERAMTLLRVLFHDLESGVRSLVVEEELTRTRPAMKHLMAENARLRAELQSRVPEVPGRPVAVAPGKRAEQVVQAMIDYVREHYQRPMSLSQVAQALNMNAAYLSDLFSRAVGVTFHQYLDELRLARAEQLLGDARLRVCEVACAVGYSSAGYFRQAFKRHFGISPHGWQQARQPAAT